MTIRNNKILILTLSFLLLFVVGCKRKDSSFLIADNSQIFDLHEIDQDYAIDLLNSVNEYVTNYQAGDYFFNFLDTGAILLVNNNRNIVFEFDENYSLSNTIELETNSQEVVIWVSKYNEQILGIVDSDIEQWGNSLNLILWDSAGNLIEQLAENVFSGEELISADLYNDFILITGQFSAVTVNFNTKTIEQIFVDDRIILDGVLINDKCFFIERELGSSYPILEEYNIELSSCENSKYVQLSDSMLAVNDVQLLKESENSLFVIFDYSNIYRFNINNISLVKVVDPSLYGISFTNSIFYNKNNQLICSYITSTNSVFNFRDNIILEISNNPTEKEFLNVAIVENDESPDSWVDCSIGMYNLYSNDAIISISNISETNIINNPNVLSENNFDVIIYPGYLINSMIRADYIADLSSYIDMFIQENNMIESIWNASTNIEGCYFITPFVKINVLAGSGNLFSNDITYSFEDLYSLHSSLPNSHVVRHDSFETLSHVFSPRLINAHLLNQSDWEKYINFLQGCASADYFEDSSIRFLISNNELMLLNENIDSYLSYEVLSRYFNDNMVFPDFDNFVNTQFVSDYVISLVNDSENKDMALSFFRYILSDNFYFSNDAFLFDSIPVTKSAFEYANNIQFDAFELDQVNGATLLQNRNENQLYFYITPNILSDSEQEFINQSILNEVEKIINSHSGNSERHSTNTSINVGIQGVGNYELCLEEYITLVNTTNNFYFYDYDGLAIVNEELSAYLSGNYDISYTAEIINDRLNTYYSESD